MRTNELERLDGKSKGGNRDVEDELRRRGYNTKMLAEVQWDWGQRQWEKIARRASKIITARNVEARRQKSREKRRRWRERQRQRNQERLRQNRIDQAARLKGAAGAVAARDDSSAADGTG